MEKIFLAAKYLRKKNASNPYDAGIVTAIPELEYGQVVLELEILLKRDERGGYKNDISTSQPPAGQTAV